MADKRIPENSPEDDAFIQEFELDLFWNKYRSLILAGVGILLVAVIAGGGYFLYSEKNRADSEALFASAQSEEEWQAVVEQYPRTPVAGNALLLIAEAQRQSGNLEASTQTYEQMLNGYPKHPLHVDALLGIAGNKELQGDLAGAVTDYQTLAARYPGSFAAAFALYLQAEILIREGKHQEASTVLRELVSQYTGSIPARLGGAQLDRIAAIQAANTAPSSQE